MRRMLVVMFIGQFLSLDYLLSHPLREPYGWQEPKKVSFAGPCEWGEIEVIGGWVFLTGEKGWSGDGEIRPDGSLLLWWSTPGSGRGAVGIYRIAKDGSIIGKWGYLHLVKIERDGSISGQFSSEVLRKAMP